MSLLSGASEAENHFTILIPGFSLEQIKSKIAKKVLMLRCVLPDRNHSHLQSSELYEWIVIATFATCRNFFVQKFHNKYLSQKQKFFLISAVSADMTLFLKKSA